MRSVILVVLLALFLSSQPVMAAQAPELVSGAQLYNRAADQFASAVIIDVASGKTLYSYLPNKKWPAASLTKLMNSLVLVDLKPSWSKKVAVTSRDSVGGGQLSLRSGTRMSIQDLLYSSLVASANNAATALARTSSVGLSGFIKKMNQKATALGLETSHFVDPSGIDPANVTTAAEMAVIAAKAYNTPVIRRAASTATYRFATSNPTVKKEIKNTNQLLTKDDEIYVLGGKTGFLYESRYNLAVKMRPMDADPNKPPLLIVVMGSPTYAGSFASAKGLANWAWKAYDWQSQ